MKIAVLGAGGLGAAVALELSQAGHEIDIFESREKPLLGASSVNEGKIHQGLIYAKDKAEKTARIMADGALDFRQDLSRWIDTDEAFSLSTPFIYAVHQDSQLTPEELGAHFDRCCRIFNELRQNGRRDYLGFREPMRTERVSTQEMQDAVGSDAFVAGFQTNEYAVDPRRVAAALVDALRSAPKVALHMKCHVASIETRMSGKLDVVFDDGRKEGPYDQVINATWEGRMAIDRSMGLAPPMVWSLRHKFGHRVAIPLENDELPSITGVLGAFGDIVNFGAKGFFLSWYPTGMVEMKRNESMSKNWHAISRQNRLENFRISSAHWRDLCPKLSVLRFQEDAIDPTSGVIYAHGDTDIDELDSVLHVRTDLAIQSVGAYHSVNTSKYTLMPQMAVALADRILSRENRRST